MNILKKMVLGLFLIHLASTSVAANEVLNETLVRVINQINAILPLLDEAKEEIEPNGRVLLHVEQFVGPDGKNHAGVREDLIAIRNGLIEFINEPVLSPKTIKPLELDYVGRG